MKNYLSAKVTLAKMKAIDWTEKFIKDEMGETNFVAMIVIIVIILGLAALFREQLLELATKVLGQLTDFVG